jgi:hypothetical protein
MNAATPPLDLEQTRAFLAALAPGERVTLQTFDDGPDKRPGLARILHGTLERHADLLKRLNKHGAGVFVMISEGDGKGRKEKNVIRVRAVFADFDGVALPERWALKPHILVLSSPGKHHVYWLVCDLPLDEFKPLQKALAAHYGSDSSVSDKNRVMRLPGFYHCKGEPVMVKLLEVSAHPAYTRADLLAAWPAVAEALKPKPARAPRASSNRAPPTDVNSRILEATLDRYSATGTRHEGAKWLACQCWWNDLDRGEAEKLATAYAEGVREPFDAAEALELVDWAYTEKPPGEPWQTRVTVKSYRGRIYDRMRRQRHG